MKTSEKLHRQRRIFGALMWAIIALAVLCMLGIIACLVMLGFNLAKPDLLGILSAAFVGGAAVFGGLGYLCYRKNDQIAEAELDALEREDGEDSFYIGEGTLATFEEGQLRIHGGEGTKTRTIVIPYLSMRFFSVCTRRAPKEKGSWSVVMEIPAHYLAKGKPRKSDPPVLIQTEGKERLYSCLEKYGITLLGEQPQTEISAKKFERVRKFTLPDTKKRGRALLLIILGFALLVGGIAAAIWWETTVGAVIIVVGGYVGVRAAFAHVRAKAEFVIYREGIFYREPSGADNVFLKWEEFSSVCIFEQEGRQYLRVQCLYGAYDFPNFDGAYQYIVEHYPEKK